MKDIIRKYRTVTDTINDLIIKKRQEYVDAENHKHKILGGNIRDPGARRKVNDPPGDDPPGGYVIHIEFDPILEDE